MPQKLPYWRFYACSPRHHCAWRGVFHLSMMQKFVLVHIKILVVIMRQQFQIHGYKYEVSPKHQPGYRQMQKWLAWRMSGIRRSGQVSTKVDWSKIPFANQARPLKKSPGFCFLHFKFICLFYVNAVTQRWQLVKQEISLMTMLVTDSLKIQTSNDRSKSSAKNIVGFRCVFMSKVTLEYCDGAPWWDKPEDRSPAPLKRPTQRLFCKG